MKWFMVLTALLMSVEIAGAQGKPPEPSVQQVCQAILDKWKKGGPEPGPMDKLMCVVFWKIPEDPNKPPEPTTGEKLQQVCQAILERGSPEPSMPEKLMCIGVWLSPWDITLDNFTRQVAEALPLLEEMGFEVATFRVQWGLPPKAKLRVRSTTETNLDKLEPIVRKGSGGIITSALLTSAATAKRLQSNMKLGTAILDVDLALNPKVRMSFLKARSDKKELVERDVEDLDLACGQALN
jgi:hypothetical protein